MNKTDQILECMLSFFSFLPPPFFWLPTLSGNCSVEQRVLWMKDWYEETWMSTQALKDSLLMKYSKSHFQGGWKFSVMCTNAFDKKKLYISNNYRSVGSGDKENKVSSYAPKYYGEVCR